MIHEITPDIYYPEYRNIKSANLDTALVYSGKSAILVLKDNEGYRLPTIGEIKEIKSIEKDSETYNDYYLFSISENKYFLVELQDAVNDKITYIKTLDENPRDEELYMNKYVYMSIHRFRELNPVVMVFAGATGYHIRNWKETVKYCGKCGSITKPSDTERAFVCTGCGHTAYPQVAPAVIVAVINKDKILLVRNLKRPKNVRLELVSGYVEVGESFEHAVHREVMEEVGLKIKDIWFYKDQPWGISGAHMIGYVAYVDGDDTIVKQDDEIIEAKWYTRDEVPEYRNRLSVGSEMILKFKTGEIK
ncbi:MAG: NAD(+) diphosphatase [Lachnospiraceae bacterium]|nr:NAD(+) diphosphatase [Lachnospiraceae bacterium]